MESLILAQNERWRHGLGMQVERTVFRKRDGQWRKGEERVSNLPCGPEQPRETGINAGYGCPSIDGRTKGAIRRGMGSRPISLLAG